MTLQNRRWDTERCVLAYCPGKPPTTCRVRKRAKNVTASNTATAFDAVLSACICLPTPQLKTIAAPNTRRGGRSGDDPGSSKAVPSERPNHQRAIRELCL